MSTGSEVPVAAPNFWQRPDPYHVAVGLRGSIGGADFNPAVAAIGEIYTRYQWVYGLGVQASYFHLGVGNADQEVDFTSNSFTLGPTWHPLRGFWFDPFIEAHVVRYFGAYLDYNGMNERKKDGVGFEGVAGLQLASRNFAGGLHVRYGDASIHPAVQYGATHASWSGLGLQIEARL